MDAASATAVVSEPPRPSVVTSRLSVETPWKPATRTIRSCSRAWRMRSARASMIRALVGEESVTIPACEPVSEIASCPMSWIAIAQRAQEIRSPVESSMSISRATGRAEISCAWATSSSVVLPRAESTATTRLPASRAATIRPAARLMRSASATEVPPNFITTISGPCSGTTTEDRERSRVAVLSPINRVVVEPKTSQMPMVEADAGRAPEAGRLLVASRLGTALSRAASVETVAREAVRALHESFDYYLAVVQRLAPDGVLRVVALAGPSAAEVENLLARGQRVEVGINGRVARTGRPALVHDTSLDPASPGR